MKVGDNLYGYKYCEMMRELYYIMIKWTNTLSAAAIDLKYYQNFNNGDSGMMIPNYEFKMKRLIQTFSLYKYYFQTYRGDKNWSNIEFALSKFFRKI